MPKLSDFYALMWGDATPTERLKLARIAFRIVVATHILWACGFLAPIGLIGFAWSNEVDDKIEAATKPIQSRLDEITHSLSESREIQKRILVGQIASQLRDLHRAKCQTGDAFVRQRMERDIEDSQQEYRNLTGERYPLPTCAEL